MPENKPAAAALLLVVLSDPAETEGQTERKGGEGAVLELVRLAVALQKRLAFLQWLSLSDGPLFETEVLNELLRWSSWQPDPPSLHYYRTRSGREVDFLMYAPHGLLVVEAKAGSKAHREDARPLEDLLQKLLPSGVKADAWRLGIVVTRGREVESPSEHVWAVPDWRLFGPAG